VDPLTGRAHGGLLAILLSGAFVALAAQASPADLGTRAERTGFRETGRYDEVERLCAAFAKRWPKRVRCFEFGRTPQGRPMLALAASVDGVLTSKAARAAKRPVLLFQGGIHAGEIDGKDAGFLALRDLLEGSAAPGALARVTWLFVPVFNVDGQERFGPWHRPNQRGPEETGWRTTAQRLNLNRDYMKAEAPEMQAMLRLLEAWDPILYADLHVTDGAKFRHDISIQAEPSLGWDRELGRAGSSLQQDVVARLEQAGFLALPFYPSFVTADQPESGFQVGVSPPRYSTGYWASRNRLGVLVETHSWKPYARRVQATRTSILALTELAARDGGHWLELAREADARATALGGQAVSLAWANTDDVRTIDFQGYAYTRVPSEVSGTDWIRYDESKPEVWRVPLQYAVHPTFSPVAPRGGYLVPPEHALWMAPRLDLHGIRYEILRSAQPGKAVQAFRAATVTRAATSLEGRYLVSVTGEWREELRDIPAGTLFVPIGQPRATVAMGLLEPQAPDSFLAWEYFANAFEPKEYMENYLAEEIAREMLAKDAALAAEFARRLREDPAFAASPAQRLEFFSRRHSAWDEQLNLYPVFRVGQRPVE